MTKTNEAAQGNQWDETTTEVASNIVAAYEENLEPMTNSEMKDFLMNNGDLMSVLEYGYTSSDIADPEMKKLWEEAMDKYVELGEIIDKMEQLLIET